MRKLSSLASAGCAALAAGTLAAVAAADPLTISTAQTTAVATATAANNTPGDITIAAGGSITVTSGAAATINSANILTSGGTIANSGTAGAIGVLINSPGPLTFTNNSAITLAGTAGSGDIGVSLTGAGSTGSIVFGTGGSVSVAGDNGTGVALAAPFTGPVTLRSVTASGAASTAIALTAPLTGSLSFAGTTTAQGAGSTGVLIAAPVSGSVTNGGAVSAGTVRGINTSGVIVAGNTAVAGVRISSSIGQGFVNDRYYVDATGAVVPPASVNTAVNSLVIGTITATGTAPAVWIGPGASNQPVALGAVGTGNDAFGFVNRGAVTTNIADAGQATVGVRVGGPGATTTLAGGIINQATASIGANSLDARATALDVQTGAVVPQLVNQGAIGAATTASASTSTTAAGPGGQAVTIMIEPGAALGQIVNSGSITATSVGTHNGATAVLDQSGNITAITNTGTISATAPGTGGATVAIDLGIGSGPVTLTNSGTITGDVVLGQGATTVALTGGTISGALSFGKSAANTLALERHHQFFGIAGHRRADRADARRQQPPQPRRPGLGRAAGRVGLGHRHVDAGRPGPDQRRSADGDRRGQLHRGEHRFGVAAVARADAERDADFGRRRNHHRPSADPRRCVERAVSVHRDARGADADDAIDRADPQERGRHRADRRAGQPVRRVDPGAGEQPGRNRRRSPT